LITVESHSLTVYFLLVSCISCCYSNRRPVIRPAALCRLLPQCQPHVRRQGGLQGPPRLATWSPAALSNATRGAGPPVIAQTPPASRGSRERDRAGSAHRAASPPCRA